MSISMPKPQVASPISALGIAKLNISHITTYSYESMVTGGCIQYLRITPQTLATQRVLRWDLSIPGQSSTQSDGFGNLWTTLYLDTPHSELLIMAQGVVEIDMDAEAIVDTRVPAEIYLAQTGLTAMDAAMHAFAQAHLQRVDRQGLIDFSAALLEEIPYHQGHTESYTTASEAFKLKRGVCQDHSHIFLACVRSRGLMARYVSGYLYIEETGHFASHAWAEVLLDGRWYCFDTSNQIFTPRQHIQLAVGRDYLDAAPVRGVRSGGGMETMKVSVQVVLS